MARIYNPTMLMLDPSNVMNAVRLGREREAEERATRQGILSGVKSLGESAGGLIGRGLRQSEIGEVPEESDEEWKAVVERFVDTGDVSGINAYRQRQAEKAYRDKMAEIQKMEAESAKASAKASLKEQGLKEQQMIQEKIDEAQYDLSRAINAYRKAKPENEKREAMTDYEYAKKRLKRLGVSDDEIRALPVKEEIKVKTEVETEGTETGTEEPQKAFGKENYLSQKNDIKNRLNEKFETQEDVNNLVKELTALSNTEFGSEDSDLVEFFNRARKIVPETTKKLNARLAKVKNAELWKSLEPRHKKAMKEEDRKKLMKDYEDAIAYPDYEQLVKQIK